MKKKITKLVSLALMLVIIATAILPMTKVRAMGDNYNCYKDVKYYSTEDIKELESTLKADGYVEISKDYYDELSKTDYWWYGYLQPQMTGKLWVESNAWNEYLQTGAVEQMNEATVITDNYENEQSDQSKLSTHYGENIEEGADWGTIIIKGVMDTEVLESGNHPQAFVTVWNKTLDERYQFTLDYYNNYTTSVNCPSGQYVIASAYIDEKYPAVVENEEVNVYGDGQTLNNMGSVTFNVTYGTPTTKEEYLGETTPEPVVDENESTTPYKIIIIVGIVLVIALIGGIIFWIKKIKKQNEN